MLERSSLGPARVKYTPRTAVLKNNAGLNSDVLCAPALRQASEGKRGYERRGNQREEGMLPVLASHG